MERDGHHCVRCGAWLTTNWPSYSCHHRQSKSVGPDTLDNRIMLCGTGSTGCHAWVHQHPAESRANGWIVSKYVNPDTLSEVPCKHYQLGWVTYDSGGYVNGETP